jgi:hypothetical protein
METLGIKYNKIDTKKILLAKELAQSCNWVWFYDNICFVVDRPKSIKKKGIQLHSDGSPAVEFRDGWRVWFLNGVEVEQEIAETPADKLDPQLITKTKNAEVRREIVRKIGIERVLNKLGAQTIDKVNGYELVSVDIGHGEKRPYLKMKNPSIENVYHIEGVPPGIDTVEKALNYRKPEALANIPISENGDDWFQQGDVCIWQENSKFVKPNPIILT